MCNQIESLKLKTAKPIVAGVFDIVIGSFCLLGVMVLGILGFFFMAVLPDLPAHLGFIFWLAIIPMIAIGVVSIIGGIYSLQRRLWGWALAASITTACVSNLLGIISIVLTALSKNEFTDNEIKS